MHITLPKTTHEFSTWSWSQIEPAMRELAERRLTAQNLAEWLADWSHLRSLTELFDGAHHRRSPINLIGLKNG